VRQGHARHPRYRPQPHLPLLHLLHPRPLRHRYLRRAPLNADAVDAAVLDALAGFYRDHRDLIAEAVEQAQREHRAAHGNRRAELDGITAELARTHQATDRYLLAFERGNLDEDLVAERLAALKTACQQLTARRDELTVALDDEPTAPDPTVLDQVADHLAEIINTGALNQRKALVEALVERVIITGPDRLVPVFRIPQPSDEDGAASAHQRKRPRTVRFAQ
jgi:site-specific DNA recombinase